MKTTRGHDKQLVLLLGMKKTPQADLDSAVSMTPRSFFICEYLRESEKLMHFCIFDILKHWYRMRLRFRGVKQLAFDNQLFETDLIFNNFSTVPQ